ncbi:transcriptional regulator [Acinetobacter nosocomialis]|uniref:Transcriptional regulator n=1 Tax=Acinetobacter baumannii TaxID=470 RepID=A0A241Z9Z4_ACIBA|nr:MULTISPECIES: transcriptional regulator [Acinetobacter calcoaceticus/baumannii complex]MCZ3293166.1 transcriptional regulator [Acinetobacter baumannii]MDC4964892.1 transcriptional regulator [Acinetobacter baumannii]MDH2552402.1 transcriptional regulator [Acinetobacter baumannii]MDI7709629.1 transcriptional regulator [Acinetobacter baumannii]OTM79764.1 transcriptional regulator [Acinetobacter baumannii]
MENIQPLRLSMNKVCSMLDITREGLRKLMINDPKFPRALKSGPSRQAAVYFDYQDLLNWYESQKNQNYS